MRRRHTWPGALVLGVLGLLLTSGLRRQNAPGISRTCPPGHGVQGAREWDGEWSGPCE